MPRRPAPRRAPVSEPVPSRRRGALRIADIPPPILRQLNAGEIEAATLAECLAIDFGRLFRAVAPDAGTTAWERMDALEEVPYTRRMVRASEILFECYGPRAIPRFQSHTSDTVRCWTLGVINLLPGLTLSRRLSRMRPFADDDNAGTREWAWMTLRPRLAADLETALALMGDWTGAKSANLRRFAVESLRPRGVWCQHVDRLKREPELGLPLLEPLRSDPARYVQLSVANWLNDASKSQPDWVIATTRRWLRETNSGATQWIVRHALRTLRKQGRSG